MHKNQTGKIFGVVDGVLLSLSAIFLFSTMIRTGSMENINRFRERVIDFVGGKLSAQDVVRAFGDWGEFDTAVTAVFASADTTVEKAINTHVNSKSDRFEQDVLTKESVLFPDIVDPLVYSIDLPCKTPAKGILTSEFGERDDPLDGEASYHYGVDIAADEGEAICSVASGYVVEVGDNSYGKYAVIDHQNGLQSLYAHCSSIDVTEGEWVEAEERIAAVGMTGRATGNHLHFELWRAGKILDPMNYIEV